MQPSLVSDDLKKRQKNAPASHRSSRAPPTRAPSPRAKNSLRWAGAGPARALGEAWGVRDEWAGGTPASVDSREEHKGLTAYALVVGPPPAAGRAPEALHAQPMLRS